MGSDISTVNVFRWRYYCFIFIYDNRILVMGRISQRSLRRAGKEFDLYFRTNDMIKKKSKEDNVNDAILLLEKAWKVLSCFNDDNMSKFNYMLQDEKINVFTLFSEIDQTLKYKFNVKPSINLTTYENATRRD